MAELPDEQDMLTEEEIEGSLTPSPLPTSLWRRMWRASITAVAYLLLYILSQVTVSLQTFYTNLRHFRTFLSDIYDLKTSPTSILTSTKDSTCLSI